MRKLKRNVARAKMLKEGCTHINKKVDNKGEKKSSYFSRHWRDYV